MLTPDSTSLGLRLLVHLHVDEQPFTRSLGAFVVPSGTDHVMIRARCLADGWAAELFRVNLPS